MVPAIRKPEKVVAGAKVHDVDEVLLPVALEDHLAQSIDVSDGLGEAGNEVAAAERFDRHGQQLGDGRRRGEAIRLQERFERNHLEDSVHARFLSLHEEVPVPGKGLRLVRGRYPGAAYPCQQKVGCIIVARPCRIRP